MNPFDREETRRRRGSRGNCMGKHTRQRSAMRLPQIPMFTEQQASASSVLRAGRCSRPRLCLPSFMTYIYTTQICRCLECSLRQAAGRIPRVNAIVVFLLYLRQRASRARSPLPATIAVISIAFHSTAFFRHSRDASERAGN